MLKIIDYKKNNKVIISLIIILVGISCIIWSLININTYSNYSTEDKRPIGINNNEVENVSIGINNEIEQVPKYKERPAKGDYIGTINFPTLDKTFPIYEGTSSAELKKGVGHFTESVLPGLKNNSVLSAHRDTAFKEIGKLKIGDKIIIDVEFAKFVYEVIGIRIVSKDDRTVIVPTEDGILTLTTCYPFNHIGKTIERYIVSSILIDIRDNTY